MLPTATTTTSYSASVVKTMVKVLAVVCLVVIASLQTMGVGLFPTFNSSFEKVLAIASEVAVTSPTIPNGVRANNNAVDFSGSYADPNHPNCLREIKVTDSIADITGTDGNPGCPPDGSGDPWELTGTVDGDTILVDFSPKGGPKDLKGVYEETPVPGIRWPDGNMWTRKKSAHLRK